MLSNSLLLLDKELSEGQLMQAARESLGIVWAELSKDWLPIKIPHCTLSIYISVSIQSKTSIAASAFFSEAAFSIRKKRPSLHTYIYK